ncbi:MAG: Mur ligase family protein, partial [Chthoniobacterales bacterium]|nr:Mur ligase family protein [Chthoniobacterales bacterium]
MNATPLITIAERAGARVVGIEKLERLEEVQVTGFIHDSRQVRVGDVFVALEGRNTDGHKFLKHARDKGAVAALVKKGNNWEEVAGLVLLECEDPLASLQRVARWWRGELKAVVIAISGCSGKTSTKRMLASILKKAGSVTSTPGNWNNQIGLPLTILNACREDEYAVWELGSNRPGEIAELARMARPMFSIVTNIGTAHIEFFGNRMGIALEEGSVFSETAKEGGCFYPGRDDFADTLEWLAGERARPVYLDAGDPSAKDIRNGVDGIRFVLNMRGRGHAVRLKQPGRHIVMDSLLATAVAIQMGMDGERVGQG